MCSIMEQLYDAQIGNNNKRHSPDSNYESTAHAKSKIYDELISLLTEKQNELFLKYVDIENELTGIIEFERFTYGVQFGTHLMLEIM